MSELVSAHGRSSEDDLTWMHALLGDLQLLADLAFADIVLWSPSAEGAFVAVAHARPSSAATLFYRDFVGQVVKPDWRHLVSDAFDRGELSGGTTGLGEGNVLLADAPGGHAVWHELAARFPAPSSCARKAR